MRPVKFIHHKGHEASEAYRTGVDDIGFQDLLEILCPLRTHPTRCPVPQILSVSSERGGGAIECVMSMRLRQDEQTVLSSCCNLASYTHCLHTYTTWKMKLPRCTMNSDLATQCRPPPPHPPTTRPISLRTKPIFSHLPHSLKKASPFVHAFPITTPSLTSSPSPATSSTSTYPASSQLHVTCCVTLFSILFALSTPRSMTTPL